MSFCFLSLIRTLEEGRKGGREGGRERGREGRREGGRGEEGEGGREGERNREREGRGRKEREIDVCTCQSAVYMNEYIKGMITQYYLIR